ncbi:MAG: phytoene desaturase family protein [Myxococcota bacterium]
MSDAFPTAIPRPSTRARGRRGAYDAIVIGSGVGGSVTAGQLAHWGARVLVLEKNDALGGILASYHREGFKLDVGSHLISRGARGPMGVALAGAGLDRPRFLTHPIPVRSRGVFDVAAPERRGELLGVGLQVARALGLPRRDALALARMMFQVFTLTEVELRAWDRRTLDAFIRQHTEHPAAYFLFSFLASIFFVLPPWQVSGGEAIRALRGVLWSYSLSYVEGGMDGIAHALLGRVVEADGDVVTGQRVVAIRPRASGLVVATGDGAEYEAPAVACNMAPADMLALLDGADVPDAYVERVGGIRPSGNAHQIKLALRRPLVEEGCLIGGASLRGVELGELSIGLMEDVVEAIEAGRVPDPIPVYCPVPTNYDPTLGPPGTQLLVASVYGPSREDPEDPPELWRERSLEALARMIPGLMDELVFVEFTPVPAIGRWMGKSNNGAICNGQLPGQVGRDRLPVTTPVEGLYLCGDGAGGRGIGTELAARSAMEVVRAIGRAAAEARGVRRAA